MLKFGLYVVCIQYTIVIWIWFQQTDLCLHSIGFPVFSKFDVIAEMRCHKLKQVSNVTDSTFCLSNFPFIVFCNRSGKILDVEVVDGGLICSSGVHVEEMGDKNDDCYIVNAAVYVGY